MTKIQIKKIGYSTIAIQTPEGNWFEIEVESDRLLVTAVGHGKRLSVYGFGRKLLIENHRQLTIESE